MIDSEMVKYWTISPEMNNDINMMLSLLLFKMVLKITLSIIRQGKGKYEDFKEKKKLKLIMKVKILPREIQNSIQKNRIVELARSLCICLIWKNKM